jgi:nicotinamide riboside kinase
MAGLAVAIVGAESTGKSTLAQDLALQLGRATGLRCTAVGEHLREWCERAGRTPLAHEQAAIAQTQLALIDAARLDHELVIADTTPLMTAIYSQLLFDDGSLLDSALEAQRRFALTLLTALDLPWVADGLQRDGAHVQAPVNAALRQALIRSGQPWSVVSGHGQDRVEAALTAVTPLLSTRVKPGQGLFTRLQARQDALPSQAWICRDCDVPECEHASLRQIRDPASALR